ncbi:MAG: N-acetyl-gamma-glutamyl-phosphate reductase [Dehalococcoidia bacterium]|nr:N-acetyl-gamma-glutamyl-phosphate reductase [Dehalococcoidia bacterium]MDH4299744.1 N-acetyl-gamma-glutamyl-phosphate reductase [Dehalococcoidia bacterium]
MPKIRAGIINVTGYIGAELARLLCQHPLVNLVTVTGRSAAGQKLGDVFPSLAGTDYTIEAELDAKIDVAFSAMPHKSSVDIVPSLLKQGIRIVDASADFRLRNADEYPRWYGFTHPSPELLKEAVFGLPELHHDEIVSASLVANPGCYSTGAILALAPAVKAGLVGGDLVVDSKSGVSGAGRTPTLTTHYSEANEDICAYSLQGHRHLPEIAQELKALDMSMSPSLTFVPHLVPMTRGILSTCYARLSDDKLLRETRPEKELSQIYREFYKHAPFVRITTQPPHTKHVWGTNFCLIYPTIDSRTDRLIVISCLDNLVKGGAGQAVQNMNLMFDTPQTTGLEALAIYP